LNELEQLANTAGARVVGRVSQRLSRPSRTYLGKGKLEELQQLVQAAQADVVILDDELTPAQQLVIERTTNVKVIDRTALILDIFAQRAQTREGRLQVDLAQHEYLLPRLSGQWSHLERLGGGIGTRGPGETQIETDRRLVSYRIQRLKAQLDDVRTRRDQQRKHRMKQGLPVASLIGYTNAGKSTLFNTLGRAQTVVQDKLFATLDPVTRRARFPSGRTFLLTDTVGFINKLPHGLVAAFRATLEELNDADFLVHVVDVTHPNAAEQTGVVDQTLDELGLRGKPLVVALNKIDLAMPGTRSEDELTEAVEDLRQSLGPAEQPTVLVSAHKGWRMDELLNVMESTHERAKLPAGVIEVG
jgi:GTP-binding protein HflX